MSPFYGGSPEMVRLTAARIRATRGLWQPLTDWLLGLLDREASNLRTDGGESLAAPPSDAVASIRILIGADPIAVSVAVAAVVVVVVVVVIAVGPYRSGSDRCRTVGRTSIGTAIGRAAINPSGSRRARYRGAGDWTGHMSVSPGMDSPAPVAPGTHAAAMEAASTHAAAVKSSASASKATTTTAATSKGVVGNEAGANQNEHCHSSEYVAKHGVPPLAGVPCIVAAMPLALRIGTRR
jgi:hypothetical protein